MVTAGVAWSYTGPWWSALASRVPGGDRRSVRDATWSRGASGNSGNSGESQGDNPGSVRDSRGHGEKTRQKRCTAGTAVQGCGGVGGRQQERPGGIRARSGCAVSSWAPIWHSCAAAVARPVQQSPSLKTQVCVAGCSRPILRGSGHSMSAASGLAAQVVAKGRFLDWFSMS